MMAQKLIKLSKKLFGKVMPPASGKGPRVKIYDKNANYQNTKVFKNGRVEGTGAKLPKSVIQKAQDLLPAAVVFLGDLIDPFDAEALGNGELPEGWLEQTSPCGK